MITSTPFPPQVAEGGFFGPAVHVPQVVDLNGNLTQGSGAEGSFLQCVGSQGSHLQVAGYQGAGELGNGVRAPNAGVVLQGAAVHGQGVQTSNALHDVGVNGLHFQPMGLRHVGVAESQFTIELPRVTGQNLLNIPAITGQGEFKSGEFFDWSKRLFEWSRRIFEYPARSFGSEEEG